MISGTVNRMDFTPTIRLFCMTQLTLRRLFWMCLICVPDLTSYVLKEIGLFLKAEIQSLRVSTWEKFSNAKGATWQSILVANDSYKWPSVDSQQENEGFNLQMQQTEFSHNHTSLKRTPKLQMTTQPSQQPDLNLMRPWAKNSGKPQNWKLTNGSRFKLFSLWWLGYTTQKN